MKKLILVALISLGLSSSLSAKVGTIDSISIDAEKVAIVVGGSWNPVALTGESLQQFLAVALTAKSTGATVDVTWSDNSWVAIKMQ